MQSTVFLQELPDADAGFEVRVGGQVIPGDDGQGGRIWNYDPIQNAIVFADGYAPQTGMSIEVEFAPVCSL